MPRLLRDAPLNGIWEGSGNVIALDVLRALAREPEGLPAFLAECELGPRRRRAARRPPRRAPARSPSCGRAQWLGAPRASRTSRSRSRPRCSSATRPPAVADAFCAGRLGDARGRVVRHAARAASTAPRSWNARWICTTRAGCRSRKPIPRIHRFSDLHAHLDIPRAVSPRTSRRCVDGIVERRPTAGIDPARRHDRVSRALRQPHRLLTTDRETRRRLRADDRPRPARRRARGRDRAAWPTTTARWSPARCSSASPGSRATATTSPPTRWRAARPRSSSRGPLGARRPGGAWSTTSAPRWRPPPRASTATRRRRCPSSGSPAPTARRRRRTSSARCSRRRAGRAACSAP